LPVLQLSAPLVVLPGSRRLSITQSRRPAVVTLCVLEATPHRPSSLSGKRSSDRPNADDDPPLVIQDMDLLSSLALELSHTENSTPDGFEVRRRMPLPRQPRPIPADQAEFVIRHSVSSCSRPLHAKRLARAKVPRAPIFEPIYLASRMCNSGFDQPAVAFASVFCDFRSKNKAWLITALTESALKGLVIKNAGSGAWPVRKRSGKAVMKMTGTS
jgi:hypothetical protein